MTLDPTCSCSSKHLREHTPSLKDLIFTRREFLERTGMGFGAMSLASILGVTMGGSADGKGQTGPGKQAATAAESESMRPSELPRETQSAPEPESVPEPYREAVKRYFTPEG